MVHQLTKKSSTSKEEFILPTNEDILEAVRQHEKNGGESRLTKILSKNFFTTTPDKNSEQNVYIQYKQYHSKHLITKLMEKKITRCPKIQSYIKSEQ